MKINTLSQINRNAQGFLSDNEPIEALLQTDEIVMGIKDEEFTINSFKVEQKVIQISNSTNISVSGFANGNSDIQSLKTRYLLLLYSNKFKTIVDGEGNSIRKRYGYGYGFTLNVSEITTKIGLNFGLLAASSNLGLARVGIELGVYGVLDPSLAAFLPVQDKNFSLGTYEQLQKFVEEARKYLKTANTDNLFPIEILNPLEAKLESDDVESIYYGVTQVSKGKKLIDVLNDLKSKQQTINENVVKYIYNYFGIQNAYIDPSNSQIKNAKFWISGKYNKVQEFGVQNDCWVAIDPSIENKQFVALSHLPNPKEYQPHSKPTNWANAAKKLNYIDSEISLDFSNSLKISSIIDATGKFNTRTIIRDIALYLDHSDDPAEGSKVIETRYGVSVRIIFKISNVEFGTKISYSNIGAASELRHADIEFEISGIGINDNTFLDILPGPIDINQKSLDQLEEAFNKLKNKLAATDVSKFDPQPFMIRVNEPDKVDPTINAQSKVFAYSEIANKNSKNDAFVKGVSLGLNKNIIENLYNDFGLNNSIKPSNNDKNKAKDWLDLKWTQD